MSCEPVRQKPLPTYQSVLANRVASAIHHCLIRLAGGGFVPRTLGSFNNERTSLPFSTNSAWREELEEIASSSVSFPNGLNHANSDNINGSPSDVHVRAALMLFNRIHKRHCHWNSTENSTNQKYLSSKSEFSFDILSDMGTSREIVNVQSLAQFLSIELEQELLHTTTIPTTNSTCTLNSNVNMQISDKYISLESLSSFAKYNDPDTNFFDIRASPSGIICLVSSARAQQLYSAGRFPCSHCIQWCKGTKGLWWHQLKAHGIDYSNAMEAAAAAANEFAIVASNQTTTSRTIDKKHIVPTGVEHTHQLTPFSITSSTMLDAFEAVKMGDIKSFISFVEGGFHPDNQLDRNGATVLHWAAGCGHLTILSYLIEKCECCPNRGQIGKRSFSGRTPLHWAARNGHLHVVQYLIDKCHVDIEAKTMDGTSAFCWAAWQGHLDVMKCLRKNRCNIHSLNTFGCNAVLWCAQGASTSSTPTTTTVATATPHVFTWLLEIGSDFYRINDNGHGPLHKAAQRGSTPACKWLVDNVLLINFASANAAMVMNRLSLIGPDAEGACPSDLCGMNGYENLAQWLSQQECNFIQTLYSSFNNMDDLFNNIAHCDKVSKCTLKIPLWLQQGISNASLSVVAPTMMNTVTSAATNGTSKMISTLLKCMAPQKDNIARKRTSAQIIGNISNSGIKLDNID